MAPLPAFTAEGETIMPARSDRISRIERSAVLSLSVTVVGVVTVTDSTDARSTLMLDLASSRLRSRLNLTASASMGVPSWKVTPWRSSSSRVVSSR